MKNKTKLITFVLCLFTFMVTVGSMQSFAADLNELQSNITVSGTVKDAQGLPLYGVNVIIPGSTNGTTTDADGKYTLKNVPSNATIEFSFIAYKTVSLSVAGRSIIDTVMEEDVSQLEELVVVGYGTQKAVNLTGSVSSIKFGEEQLSRPVTNVSSALAGLAPGVNVRQTSGNPGSDGAAIRIRGLGTLNSSEPLVLIDGMEAPMDAVNPNDIESISILKDAASSAIYGSKAANGVILVTTKKGSAENFKVTYSGHVSFQKPVGYTQTVSSYADYMEYMNEGFEQLNQAGNFGQDIIDKWRAAEANPNGIDPASGLPNYVAFPNTDWHKEFFGNSSPLQEHNVTLTGGSEKIRFLSSVQYLDNPGLVMKTGYKRFSFRTNLEADVTKWLTLGTRVWANEGHKEIGDFGTALGYVGQSSPGVYPYYEGVYGGPEITEERAGNPYSHHLKYNGTSVSNRINTTFFTVFKPFKGFSYEFIFNYEKRFDEQNQWTNGDIYLAKLTTQTVTTAKTTPENMITYGYRYSNKKYTLENLLKYNTTIGNHFISALAGYQEYSYYEESMSAQKKGLLDGTVHTLSSAETMESIGGGASDVATRSFFGRVNYSYKDRYLFEANLRADASSKFKKEYRWGYFPSFSAGWRVTEEDFMQGTKGWLSNLKLKGSWGKLGNTNGVGNYAYQSTYSNANYSINNAIANGLYSGVIANQLITWESTAVANVGIEVGFLQNRLNATIEAYNRVTDGILYSQTLPITVGSKSAPLENLAEVTNRGLEVSLSWRDNIGDFNYMISGNFSFNKNLVSHYKGVFEAGWETDENGNEVYVSNIGDVSTGGVNRIVEGKAINEFFIKSVYKGTGKYFNADGSVDIHGGPKDGMIRTPDDMKWFEAMRAAGYKFAPRLNNTTGTIGKTTVWYGDYIYADLNEDGIYGNSYDNYFRGISNTPKINFGMQLSAQWKGFDLSMVVAGAAGFNLYWGPHTGYNTPQVRLGVSMPKDIFADHYYYDPENPSDPRTNINAKYGRIINAESGYQNNYESDLYLFKGDYVKLKNLTFGYTIPSKIAKKIYTKGIRVYFSGENLFTLTKYPGVDPEMGAGVGYATVRQFALGLNLTF